jgi:nucleotide-binding universal stress UspA family protein
VGLRLARASGAELHVLQVVRPDVDPDRARASLAREIEPVAAHSLPVIPAESIADGIDQVLPQRAWDLVVVGASRESRIRRVLLGSIPDRLADRAPCSVLLVRHYIPRYWTRPVDQVFRNLRERLRFTRSPGDPG